MTKASMQASKQAANVLASSEESSWMKNKAAHLFADVAGGGIKAGAAQGVEQDAGRCVADVARQCGHHVRQHSDLVLHTSHARLMLHECRMVKSGVIVTGQIVVI